MTAQRAADVADEMSSVGSASLGNTVGWNAGPLESTEHGSESKGHKSYGAATCAEEGHAS